MITRALKPLVESIITFVAVHYLTGSTTTAIGIGLIPLALGWLSIGSALGAAVTVISVVAGLSWYAVPPDFKGVVHAQVKEAMGDESNQAKPPQTAHRDDADASTDAHKSNQ